MQRKKTGTSISFFLYNDPIRNNDKSTILISKQICLEVRPIEEKKMCQNMFQNALH